MFHDAGASIRRFVLVLLFGASLQAHAQWTVFDPTNLVENAATALNTARQVEEQVRANVLHLNKLKEIVAQRKQIGAGELFGTGVASSADLGRRMSEMTGFLRALDDLEGGLSDMKARFDLRFNLAQASGQTLEAYYDDKRRLASSQVKEAQAIIDSDRRTVERVNETYSQVQKWQGTIAGIDSQVGGLQMLNTQMGSVVTQSAEFLGFLAKGSTTRTTRELAKAADASAEVKRFLDLKDQARREFDASRDAALRTRR
jgi:P-type conjugative transfer protein TrbJ